MVLDQIKYLIENQDFSKMTSYGNARTILSQYSFVQLELMYQKILKTDENNKISKISDNFETIGSSKNGTYGVDQGALYKLFIFELQGQKYDYRQALAIIENAKKNGEVIPSFIKKGTPRYFELKNKLIEQYGFADYEASAIISCVDDVGACSYARICNEIFSSFIGNEELFSYMFGYPMYVTKDGEKTFNSTELLLDLYIFANTDTNGGKLIYQDKKTGELQINQNNLSVKTDPLGRFLIDAESQKYMTSTAGTESKIINKFLQSKSPNLNYDSRQLINTYYHRTTQKVFENVLEKVRTGLNQGKQISLEIYSTGNEIRIITCEPNYYDTITTNSWGEGAGHAMYVTGINQEGFLVSSWGQKYLIPFTDLLNGGEFVINESVIW